MTFRAKPVVKRASRSTHDAEDRRNFLLNLGFGVVVVSALLILAAAVGYTWWNDHLAPVGSVAGQAITKDEYRERVRIESWRLDEAVRRISTQAAAGRLTETQAAQQRQFVEQQREQLAAIALERIIDTRIQAGLAAERGITATPAEIDARLVEEATIPASRHAWVIAVAPAVSDGALEPTDAQVAEARATAGKALDDLRAGKAWEDVARRVSTDTSTRDRGGDLGWIQEEDRSLPEDFVEALFAAPVDTPTDVIEGEDGTFRIGRVTEVAEETVDELYQTKLVNDEIDLEAYRQVVAADVIRRELEDEIVADVIKPGPQRQVSEILIGESGEVSEDAIKVRHILYSPKDDPQGAGTLPDDDPAWAAAEKEAREAHDRIEADPTAFDSIARTESDEGSARGVAGTGGKLPYFGPDDAVDEAFLEAIMQPGLEAGDLLEPVRSSFGWHVIEVMYRPTDLEQARRLKEQADGGADFGRLARDFSEGRTAGSGGDLGWVARGELDEALIEAIFAAPVGGTSEVVEVEGDGIYLFAIEAEETRTPEGAQLERLRATAFSDWYSEQKGAIEIERDPAILGTIGL